MNNLVATYIDKTKLEVASFLHNHHSSLGTASEVETLPHPMHTIATLKLISRVIKTLYKVIQKVKENKEEILRLCTHAETFSPIAEVETEKRELPE